MRDVGSVFAETAFSGPLLLAVLVAAVAGLVSFASPCVLPLVPGYLGYLHRADRRQSGEPAAQPHPPRRHPVHPPGSPRSSSGTGRRFGALGTVLQAYTEVTTRVLGIVVVIMGLVFLGAGRLLPRRLRAAVDTDRRSSWRPGAGLAGAPLLGVVFGLGWSPCLGPTLAAVNALALDSGSPWRGALLAVAYAASLGVPFLLVAAGLGRGSLSAGWLRRHRTAVGRAGGGLLVVMGLLLVTGVWSTWLARLQASITSFDVLV